VFVASTKNPTIMRVCGGTPHVYKNVEPLGLSCIFNLATIAFI
jgi:hypothetical protein